MGDPWISAVSETQRLEISALASIAELCTELCVRSVHMQRFRNFFSHKCLPDTCAIPLEVVDRKNFITEFCHSKI